MAGYDNHSMSNNARAAYADGLVPASKVPGVPTALVRQFCTANEWHHTSSRYNETDFFDPHEVRCTFGLETDSDFPANPKAVATLAAAKQPAAVLVLTGVRVEWLEWGGSRNYPTCRQQAADGCRVEIKGQTATITLPTGQVLTKRLHTKGLEIDGFRVELDGERERLLAKAAGKE